MQPTVNAFDPTADYFFEEGCFVNELSNSEADTAVSIARARVPVGGTTRWHSLTGVVERYVIEAGEAEVELAALPPQPVGPGDVVLIPAGCAQRIRNLGDRELLFLAICTPRFRAECYEDLEAVAG